MIKTSSLVVILSLSPITHTELSKKQNNFYENFYEKLPPNKNTIDYNYLKSDELIEKENQKLIEEIFLR